MALERDCTGGGYRARTLSELWDAGTFAEGINYYKGGFLAGTRSSFRFVLKKRGSKPDR